MSKSDAKRKKVQDHIDFMMQEPRLRVLQDQALGPEEVHLDSFNLRYKLGPIYDLIRNPHVNTPMNIAIYGEWGAGKTTAMRWLQGLLERWNLQRNERNDIKVRFLWFYPLKYQNRQQVWQDLITEVVDATTPSSYRERTFLRRLFDTIVDILGSFKIKVKIPGDVAEGELELAPAKRLLTKYRKVPPRKARLLNEFHATLRNWIYKTLGHNERLVIFVESIDRCLPEVSIQVLEALELYLDIPKLVFIFAVNRTRIYTLFQQYQQLELHEEDYYGYLSKVFHFGVFLEPTENEIYDFIDQQLETIAFWKENLSSSEQKIFRRLFLLLAKRNPREAKRLINNAIMAGLGAMMIKIREPMQTSLTFRQGMQVFFLRKILRERYSVYRLVATATGDMFFRQWSQIVRQGRQKDFDFPSSLRVPPDFTKKVRDIYISGEAKRQDSKECQMDLTFAPEAYYPLLKNPEFSDLLHFLADNDLGELMEIEYPEGVLSLLGLLPRG